MNARRPPQIRHCPLCGIAMQARRSNRGHGTVDIFECQSCHTVIRETKSGATRPPQSDATSAEPNES